jgi:hypothetical protein
MNEGVIEEADRLAACEILGVESLLVVAVSYDYMIVLHSSQYASWTSSAIRAETDVLVYNKSIDKPSATLQFQRVHEKHLKGLDDVGKLIKQGLDGHLKTDDYRRGL